jgi:hypothetical protein
MLTCQEWRDSSDKKTDDLITKLEFARGIDVAVSID